LARPAAQPGLDPLRFLRDLVVVLVGTGLLVGAVTRWIAIPWQCGGSSMEPTLEDGDRVLVDLWTLRGRGPRPGEIVVLAGPGGEDLVKRVARDPYPGHDPYPPSAIPADSPLEPTYPVLGDNPPASSDSRAFGRVPLHRIRGLVVWRYWPPSRWGAIE
jgi:signal peptidase I